MKVILEIDHTVSKEEVVNWIEEVLKPNTPCVWGYSFEEHHCGSCHNSQLEKLEKNLTKGGIIQDSKGNLCKDGDEINLIVHHIDGREHKEVYTLKWSEQFRHFNLVNKYNVIALEDNDFEKVE